MPKSKATDMTAEQKAALRAYALRERPLLEAPPLGGLDRWRRRERAGRGRSPSDPQRPRAIAPHAHWSFPPRLTLTKKETQHARDNRSLRLPRPPYPRRS